jgi:NTP pyrophosphatase (non-canonical NTP hydrolase)
MDFDQLMHFVQQEHERLVQHYGVKGDAKTKYTMLAKLVEELGELSEAILDADSLQRSNKLNLARKHLEEEFADVLLATLLLSYELKVDIRTALKSKISKIKRRKY